MYEVHITAATPQDLAENVRVLAQALTASATPAQANVEAPPAEGEPDKAKSKGRKRASKKSDSKKPGVSYEDDVKPQLIKLSAMSEAGKQRAAEIVHAFDVKKADQIPVEHLQQVLDDVNAGIEELSAGDDDDDGMF